MNRKLILLNGVLLVMVAYGGFQLNSQYRASRARAAALRRVRISPAPAPIFTPLANDPPVLAMGYKDVAIKDLFHPSRNPDIVKDPPPAPPPPPPMPALPGYHGQMNLGAGPMALLVEKPGMPQKAIKPGEIIGQFKLVDINTSEITFAWTFNGEVARRSLREVADNSAPAAAAADVRPAVAGPSVPAPPVVASKIGPGPITGFGFKECVPNDSSPEGTVDGGFRKTIITTPFGKNCRWDPVK